MSNAPKKKPENQQPPQTLLERHLKTLVREAREHNILLRQILNQLHILGGVCS